MSSGEQQPGGEGHPQWQGPGQQSPQPTPPWQGNPYQQPGHAQPGYPQQNPYQQPGYTQGQPPYPAPPGQWTQPSPAGKPPGGGNGGRVALAVVAATAVIAAAVVGGVILLRGEGDAQPAGKGGTTVPPATAQPSGEEDEGGGADRGGGDTGEEGSGGPDPDDPRQGVLQKPDPVVAPDWQVQTIENRHNAFDVPPEDWTVNSEGTMMGYEDEREGADQGQPLVMMSAVSTYMDGWCPEAEYGLSSHAMAGTKGGQGATGTAEAAENEAANWALAAYDQHQEGTLEVSDPEPFESGHGIAGHTATATITGVPEDSGEPCGTFDGKVVTVSYLDLNNDLATWVLVADTGFEDELDEETIQQMMNSLRPYPAGES